MSVQVSLEYADFNSLGNIPSRSIDRHEAMFSFSRNIYTDFQRGCANLQSNQQCRRVLFPTFSPAFDIFCFLDNSHSAWVEMKFQCNFDLHFPNSFQRRLYMKKYMKNQKRTTQPISEQMKWAQSVLKRARGEADTCRLGKWHQESNWMGFRKVSPPERPVSLVLDQRIIKMASGHEWGSLPLWKENWGAENSESLSPGKDAPGLESQDKSGILQQCLGSEGNLTKENR